MDKYNTDTQKSIIKEKTKNGVVPSLPENIGSAGSAEEAKKKNLPKNLKN
ncbi:hypothetical protein [Flavobacterium subsaxonicum]|nr:hypothetical protein [Flavobacterium subsaxonicum]